MGTMAQMIIICLIIAILRTNAIQYPKILEIIFLIIGGSSSALWGIIISLKAKRAESLHRIIKDFFKIKQSVRHYGIVALFILIIFGFQFFTGSFLDGTKWYSFFVFFIVAIVFGGIEEIGWRYTFQPIIEQKVTFGIASTITFVSWCIWHYMYFYLTDSLQSIQHISFIIGLLGSSFGLGAIYYISNSLWLCVLYHCLLNVFSQTMMVNDLKIVIVCNAVCIILSIVMVKGRGDNNACSTAKS